MGNLASKRKRVPGREGQYEATDLVDEWLLNQVAEHVKSSQISSFAAALKVGESVLREIKAPKDQVHKVNVF